MKCSNGFFYVFFKFLGHQNHKEYKDFPIYYCTVHFEVMFILDFRVKQYLKYHMNKHSTVKPFECDVCKNGSNTRSPTKNTWPWVGTEK